MFCGHRINLPTATLAVFGLAACGFSQTSSTITDPSAPSDPNEQIIWSAFKNLETNPLIEFDMSGTSTFNGANSSFSSRMYWSVGMDPTSKQPTLAQVELDDYDPRYSATLPVRRYVGDGKNFWAYDFGNKTYSDSFYSYYNNPPTTNYSGTDATKLLSSMYTAVRDPDSYLVRLLAEVNPYFDTSKPLDSTYSSWAPGYSVGQPATAPATQDPLVPSRFYLDGGTEIYVLYPNPYAVTSGSKPTRSVAFKLYDSSNGQGPPIWNLESIYLADAGPGRIVDWSIQVSYPEPTALPTGTFLHYTAAAIQQNGLRLVMGERTSNN